VPVYTEKEKGLISFADQKKGKPSQNESKKISALMGGKKKKTGHTFVRGSRKRKEKVYLVSLGKSQKNGLLLLKGGTATQIGAERKKVTVDWRKIKKKKNLLFRGEKKKTRKKTVRGCPELAKKAVLYHQRRGTNFPHTFFCVRGKTSGRRKGERCPLAGRKRTRASLGEKKENPPFWKEGEKAAGSEGKKKEKKKRFGRKFKGGRFLSGRKKKDLLQLPMKGKKERRCGANLGKKRPFNP